MSNYWTPEEIVIHEDVVEDEVTQRIINKCFGVDKRYVSNGSPEHVREKSFILKAAKQKGGYLHQILEGKKVLYIGPPGNDIITPFELDGSRMVCPEFEKLRFSSNGCFYRCEWCYLKATYRTLQNYITAYAEHNKIKKHIKKYLNGTPVLFNTGELADSLALEHLTGTAREFIPWFAEQKNGYMYMLTKSANVDDILDLKHGGHTILAWSINSAEISHKFELVAPPLEERLEAARKAQEASYPIRIRLDPIVPVLGWQKIYTETIEQIFKKIQPERITLGTLRFESRFYSNRKNLLSPNSDLSELIENMTPMFAKENKEGKHSFSEDQRLEIFRFTVDKIREYSDCTIALCKESPNVWNALDMDLSKCGCVCQLDTVDMSNKSNNNNATDYI
jgi:spore photoproduct lyase